MRISAKSLFISAYPTAALVALVYAVSRLSSGEGVVAWMGWLGIVLLSAPFLGFLGRLLILWDLPRTRDHLPGLYLTTVAGLALVLGALAVGGEVDATLPLGLGLAAAFVAYDLWFSRLSRPAGPLVVGALLPEIELWGPEGQRITTADLGGRITLLLFYRGNWCPLCVAQIHELAAAYRELASRGVDVYLVSPQPAGHSASLARRVDAPMNFLVDRESAAAKALGIATSEGVPVGMEVLGYGQETVLPTAILCDREGRVFFVDATDNYRLRPEPATFLAAIDAHTSSAGC